MSALIFCREAYFRGAVLDEEDEQINSMVSEETKTHMSSLLIMYKGVMRKHVRVEIITGPAETMPNTQ